MMKHNKLLIGAFLLPLALVSVGPVFAAENADSGETQLDETQALMNSKISIADAIRTAEVETKGKAIDSGLNDENGVATYQVDIMMTNGKRLDVFVDLDSGKVVKTADAGSGDGDQSTENGEGGEQTDGNVEGNN
jgi:hypothetical protein